MRRCGTRRGERGQGCTSPSAAASSGGPACAGCRSSYPQFRPDEVVAVLEFVLALLVVMVLGWEGWGDRGARGGLERDQRFRLRFWISFDDNDSDNCRGLSREEVISKQQ